MSASGVGVRIDVVDAGLIARNVEMSGNVAVKQPTYNGYTIGGAIFVQRVCSVNTSRVGIIDPPLMPALPVAGLAAGRSLAVPQQFRSWCVSYAEITRRNVTRHACHTCPAGFGGGAIFITSGALVSIQSCVFSGNRYLF